MRPIAKEQDTLRYPLNELLGTRANVRILRLLAEEVSGPISAPEAAEQTGLTEAGARRALQGLVKTGFVERFGTGRAQQFRLRGSEPLTEGLRDLFRTERDRYQSFISNLRDALEAFSEIQVAWIDDPPTDVGQPLHIGLIANSRALSYLSDAIRQRILIAEEQYDVTIEIHSFSRADAPNVDWQSVTFLAGHAGDLTTTTDSSATHSDRLDRAARLSGVIAEMLDRDPSLKRRAERHLDALLIQDQGSASHDLREWREILSHYSNQRIKDFLVADTPRSQRLRQSSPFFAVLTADERERILDAVERKNDS